MALLDALTGNAGHKAANDQRSVLSSLIPNLATTGQDAFRTAGDQLTTGFNNARTNLGTGYGAATDAVNTGAGGALDALTRGTTGAMGQLDQAREGFAPVTDLATKFGRGSDLYSDALGINGADGNARATAAFQPSQAYQFNLDQGLDAINRRRNAGGMLNSGNADRDAQTFGAGLASQESNKWLDRLAGFNPLQLDATKSAATGGAGINLAGAGLLDNSGRAQAGVSTGQGTTLADIAKWAYGGQAGLDTGQGGALAGNTIGGLQNYQGTFTNALPQWNDTIKQDANASNQASANSLKLGTDLLKIAVGAAGGMPSFGGASVADPSFGTEQH
jgi:hypothetical protein